jgi:hypothetical protein
MWRAYQARLLHGVPATSASRNAETANRLVDATWQPIARTARVREAAALAIAAGVYGCIRKITFPGAIQQAQRSYE